MHPTPDQHYTGNCVAGNFVWGLSRVTYAGVAICGRDLSFEHSICSFEASALDGSSGSASHESARRGFAHHTDLARCHDKRSGFSLRCLLSTKIRLSAAGAAVAVMDIVVSPLPRLAMECRRLGAEKSAGKMSASAWEPVVTICDCLERTRWCVGAVVWLLESCPVWAGTFPNSMVKITVPHQTPPQFFTRAFFLRFSH